MMVATVLLYTEKKHTSFGSIYGATTCTLTLRADMPKLRLRMALRAWLHACILLRILQLKVMAFTRNTCQYELQVTLLGQS